MASLPKNLNQDTLETLIAIGTAREFIACRNAQGKWILQVHVGIRMLPLGSLRLRERGWGSLDTLSAFSEGLWVRSVTIEL